MKRRPRKKTVRHDHKNQRLSPPTAGVSAAVESSIQTSPSGQPLDRERTLQCFRDAIQKLKTAEKDTATSLALLEQFALILEVAWHPDGKETSSRQLDITYIL